MKCKMNRGFLLLIFLALLIGALNLASGVRNVEASGTIYIRADGRIDPPTANIASADNVTYTFIGNVDDSIVVERDNVTIDGAGYTLQKPEGDTGISLPYRTNVTIQHVVITGFGVGIEVFYSNNCVLHGNRIEGTTYGPAIYLSNSGYNRIDGNNASSNQRDGINILYASSNNIVANNTFNNNKQYGISISQTSNNNIIANNTFNNNKQYGIILSARCSKNVIRNNTVNYNGRGIVIVDQGTDENVIDGNTVIGSECGLDLHGGPKNNFFVGNLISSNSWGVSAGELGSGNRIVGNNITSNSGPGLSLFDSGHSEVLDNFVSGNGFGIRVVQSSNSLFDGNNASKNGVGISLDNSSYNVITDNMFSYNSQGFLVLHGCSGNVIKGNTIVSNNGSINFWGNSSSNTVYHNNFINNTNRASGGDSLNAWDNGYPSGGNYWSDYSGVDVNHDGIGDASYVIDSERLQRDHYPLMGMFSSFNATSDFNIDVASNSTINDFQYFQSNSTITMYVSNMTTAQSAGFCRICIPHKLMNVTNISVIIDDGATQVLYPNYTLYDNGTHRWIYFAYEHSTHKVDIIPELPLLFIPPLMMTTTLLATAIRKRKDN